MQDILNKLISFYWYDWVENKNTKYFNLIHLKFLMGDYNYQIKDFKVTSKNSMRIYFEVTRYLDIDSALEMKHPDYTLKFRYGKYQLIED